MDGVLQKIFMDHYPRFSATHALSRPMKQAAQALLNCRTAAMGGHYQVCPDNHESRVCYHACRHRSCPRCHALPKAQWVESQLAKLLACDHYHAIFTLPHELLELWRYNRHWFTKAMFDACRDTLTELLADERYLGATPGMIMSFHSWGRSLALHPHIHCLITGGGMTTTGQWRAVTNGYLLPVRVVKTLYRGKLLSTLMNAVNDNALDYPAGQTEVSLRRMISSLYKKDWNVRIQERYAHGQGVMLYLSRYVKGGPIQEQRITYDKDHRVTFRYTDHREKQRKTLRMTAEAFMTRVLLHVPEPGQHQTRHYGLYHAKQQGKRSKIRDMLGQPKEQKVEMDWSDFMKRLGRKDSTVCQQCGRTLEHRHPFGRNKNSYNKVYRATSIEGLSNKPFERTPFNDSGPYFLSNGASLN